MTAHSDHPHHVGELVRRLVDVLNVGLTRGAMGSVRSIWLFESDAYEVEFRRPDQICPVRAIVTSEQIDSDEQ